MSAGPVARRSQSPCARRSRRLSAASKRREMAQRAARSGALVAGGADLHPLEPPGCLGTASRTGPGARRRIGHGLSRRHVDPGAPQSGGGVKKRGSGAERDVREALGRSRGGYGTKACVITDGAGRAISFALAPRSGPRTPPGPGSGRLPAGYPGMGRRRQRRRLDVFRQVIWDQGARPAIPTRKNEAPVACPGGIYNNPTASSACGRALRNGALSQPATRKPPDPLSLSRLNHWLPRGQAHPEVMQGTADFHHEIADTLLPQADPVFHDATALDTAVDMLDPQPALVERLVGRCCASVSSSPGVSSSA